MKLKLYLFKQSQSKTWFEQRKFRVSATKAHTIVNTRMSYQKVVNILMLNFSLKGKASIHVGYGLITEKTAIQAYLKIKYGYEHIESGLIVHSNNPWICASPDGLIYNYEKQ